MRALCFDFAKRKMIQQCDNGLCKSRCTLSAEHSAPHAPRTRKQGARRGDAAWAPGPHHGAHGAQAVRECGQRDALAGARLAVEQDLARVAARGPRRRGRIALLLVFVAGRGGVGDVGAVHQVLKPRCKIWLALVGRRLRAVTGNGLIALSVRRAVGGLIIVQITFCILRPLRSACKRGCPLRRCGRGGAHVLAPSAQQGTAGRTQSHVLTASELSQNSTLL